MRAFLRPIVACFTVLCLTTICPGQNLMVKEIPLPKDAKDVSYSKRRGDIRFKVPTDMKAAGEFFKAELTATQWAKPKKDNLQKSFWVQTFTKQQKTLEVRTENRDGGCEVRLTPTGFLWDEDLAPLVKDIPIPPGASEVKYDDFFESIEFQHSQTTQELVDFFATKLESKVWSIAGEDSTSERSASLKRTAGEATLNITISTSDDRRKVRIKTSGMAWDEIKKSNEAAEKKMAVNKSSQPSAEKNVVPPRKTKAVVGIDSLEKLSSKCTLTMDGVAINLKEIVAYEVISYGQWKTHVIATAVPLKQEGLLALLKSNTPEQDWGQKWKLPSPHVKLVLDETDKPDSMQLLANNIPGSESHRELRGEAVVENGRARGTVSMPKGKFFEHQFSVELTFDVALLSRDSTPQSHLAGAPKLENSGKIVMAGRTVALANTLAYQRNQGGEKVTCIVLTEKAVDPGKIKASLEKSGEVNVSVIGFQPQIEFTINSTDELQSVNFYCDGASLTISSKDKIDSSIQVEGDRARGTVKLRNAEDVFGKKIEFQASFDTTLINASGQKLQKK